MRCSMGTGSTSGTVLGHTIRLDRELDVVDTACAGISRLLERRSMNRSENRGRETTSCVGTLDVDYTLQRLNANMASISYA
jgi:hypothetical protein